MSRAKHREVVLTTYDILINKDNQPHLGSYKSAQGTKNFGETKHFENLYKEYISKYNSFQNDDEKNNLIGAIQRTFSWGGRRFVKQETSSQDNRHYWREMEESESHETIKQLLEGGQKQEAKPESVISNSNSLRRQRRGSGNFAERAEKRQRTSSEHDKKPSATISNVAVPSYTDLVSNDTKARTVSESGSSSNSLDRKPAYEEPIPDPIFSDSIHYEDTLYNIFQGGETDTPFLDMLETQKKSSQQIDSNGARVK